MRETFLGIVYRAMHPGWAFTPESGEGATIHGGRFNRKGTPALYTSMTVATALKEAGQAFPFKLQPMTICSYEVNCEGIADLTNPLSRENLGITSQDLACEWEYGIALGKTPVSWIISDRLIKAGYTGIKVHSFAPGAGHGDVNLVFWRWEPTLPFQVKVIDDHQRLPRPSPRGKVLG